MGLFSKFVAKQSKPPEKVYVQNGIVHVATKEGPYLQAEYEPKKSQSDDEAEEDDDDEDDADEDDATEASYDPDASAPPTPAASRPPTPAAPNPVEAGAAAAGDADEAAAGSAAASNEAAADSAVAPAAADGTMAPDDPAAAEQLVVVSKPKGAKMLWGSAKAKMGNFMNINQAVKKQAAQTKVYIRGALHVYQPHLVGTSGVLWQKRWCEVKNGAFYQYLDEGDTGDNYDDRHLLNSGGVSAKDFDEFRRHSFRLNEKPLRKKDRPKPKKGAKNKKVETERWLYIMADSAEEKERWVEAIHGSTRMTAWARRTLFLIDMAILVRAEYLGPEDERKRNLFINHAKLAAGGYEYKDDPSTGVGHPVAYNHGGLTLQWWKGPPYKPPGLESARPADSERADMWVIAEVAKARSIALAVIRPDAATWMEAWRSAGYDKDAKVLELMNLVQSYEEEHDLAGVVPRQDVGSQAYWDNGSASWVVPDDIFGLLEEGIRSYRALRKKVDDVGGLFGCEYGTAFKDLQRAARKTQLCYNRCWARLLDLVRARFVFAQPKELLEAFIEMIEDPEIHVLAIKNRMDPEEDDAAIYYGGYRFLCMYVRVGEKRHICEVSFHLRQLYDLITPETRERFQTFRNLRWGEY